MSKNLDALDAENPHRNFGFVLQTENKVVSLLFVADASSAETAN